jgi:hypothetical protein
VNEAEVVPAVLKNNQLYIDGGIETFRDPGYSYPGHSEDPYFLGVSELSSQRLSNNIANPIADEWTIKIRMNETWNW